VQNAIAAARRQTQIDSKSNLPTGRLIEDHLRDLMHSEGDWTYLDLKNGSFSTSFTDVYGFVAGDEVIRFMALLVGEVNRRGWHGQRLCRAPGRDNFIVITHGRTRTSSSCGWSSASTTSAPALFVHRPRSAATCSCRTALYGDQQAPLMSLSTGSVSTRTISFRHPPRSRAGRRGSPPRLNGEDSGSRLLTSW